MPMGKCAASAHLVVIAIALALAYVAPSLAQQSSRSNFDHLRTGFPLTGAHAVAPCESCHVRGRFAGTPKDCAYCHRAGSGIAATLMPARHIPTAEACNNCHRSANSWSVAHFSHVSVAPGGCLSCHSGTMASGKPANHIMTTASCDTCHRTAAWLPVAFNHAGVAPGGCAPCHNGSKATGQPSGHMVTARSCDACHTSAAWLPVRHAHQSPYWKPHASFVTCFMCHTTRTESATWTYPYKPNCAGCHAATFALHMHFKTFTPTTVFYAVSELQDCTGSCHIYTDNTFTTILAPRTGHHHSTDGFF
jgi:hypothetical protein